MNCDNSTLKTAIIFGVGMLIYFNVLARNDIKNNPNSRLTKFTCFKKTDGESKPGCMQHHMSGWPGY